MSAKTETQSPAARHLAALNQVLLLVSLPTGIISFVLPIYGKQLGASAVEIGLLFSVFSLTTLLLRPLVGIGLDRHGRHWFLVSGLAISGLAMIGFAFSTTLTDLVLTRILQGVASAFLVLAVSAIVADLAGEENRGSAFGSVSQSTNQGGLIGTFIGFTVLFSMSFETGWRLLFFLYAAAGLFSALIAWSRMPETRAALAEKEDTRLADGLRAILRSRALVALLVVGMVTSASGSMLSPIFIIYLQEKFNVAVNIIAWAFLPSALVWALLPTRLGRLSDRFGRKPLVVLAILVAALVSFFVPRFASLAALAVLWALEAVCFAASDPASQALTTDLTDTGQRGRIFGIFAFAVSLGAVIGPLAGGWLYDSIGQAAPFVINAVVLALCALALWVTLPAPVIRAG
jgi:MFS transporter, DHA1 family, multidrug resistance protein